MQIFKTFFKVMAKYKMSITVYTLIIVFMLLVLTGALSSGNEEEEVAAEAQYTVLIKDEDNSDVSKKLVEYIGTKHILKEGDYSEDQIKDMLYYTTIREYIVIPDGFGAEFEKLVSENADLTEDITAESLLETTYDDAMPYAIFINMQIDQYLNAVKDYMGSGYSLEEASDRCADSLDTSKYVSLYKSETISTQRAYTAYQFLPFGIITIVFSGVLPVVLSFNGAEKKNRMIISSYSMAKRNLMIILGALTTSLLVVMILIAICSVTNSTDFLLTESWWLSIANSICYTICINCLLLMITSLPLGIGKENGVNTTTFITLIISMSFSFLGGTFVDLTILGDKVAAIGRFTPNYWYSTACRKIWLEGAAISDVMGSFGIVLLFGLVCLSIGLAFTKFFGNEAAK